MGWKRTGAVALTTTALAGVALGQPAQKVTGPIAEYWVSAATSSGMTMPGAGGPPAGPPARGGGFGALGGIGAMMGMGGGGAQHTLTLQLGSSTNPSAAPNADHLPPATLKAGPSLPLIGPAPVVRTTPPPEDQPQIPREYQRPRGRMLIFWGCGEHAPPGQPVVMDFAELAAGRGAENMAALMRGLNYTPMRPPSPGRNTTYGAWPNERTRTSVPSDGSLVGDHVIRGNYSPEIRFSLNPGQDFLDPITLTSNDKNPSGSAQLAWNSVPGALGYFATVIGASGGGGRGGRGQDPDVVIWSSSAGQTAAFSTPDYMSPADVNRLVASHGLLSPQQTNCTVPKVVVDASPTGLLQLAAYGQEANFSYPPRPTNRATPWNIEWTVKVRYRSQTGGLLGMTMPGMGGAMPGMPSGRGAAPPPPPTPQPRGTRPSAADILKGLSLP